jgi:hypothetical protein
MSDTEDHNNVTDDEVTESLTKPKKQRSEKQIAATEKMRAALAAKHKPAVDAKNDVKQKKEILKALKNKLNSSKEPLDIEEETDEEEHEKVSPPKKIKKVPAVSAATSSQKVKTKKQPRIIEESETESEEEIIVVKKRKKKPKKKTIIYESDTESEEEERPVPKQRETKTQQNSASKFKVTPSIAAPPKGPVCYFA